MNKRKRLAIQVFLTIVIVLSIVKCDIQEQWELEVPSFANNSELKGSQLLEENAKYALEGIYKVTEGNSVFGDTLVLRQIRDKISIFGLKNASYFILDAGSKQNTILLEGYWRFAQNDRTGLARLTLENAAAVLAGDTLSAVTLSGKYGDGGTLPQNSLHIELIKRFSAKLRSDNFIIGAHRGGGRTSDRLPYSENSVAMINFTEYMGSNAIEIDVTLTRDNIPVLYHDDDLNIRLIQKGPLYGKIQDYTFKQLRTFVKLIHGEDIPTLNEALEAVLNNTQLRFVWLDIKSPEALEYVLPLKKEYLNRAKKMGRNLNILIGIPSEEVYQKFITYEGYQTITSICELETNKVTAVNAAAWAYRWTLGIQESEIEKMHAEGRKCIVWTLDLPDFMEIYAMHGGADASHRFDGILTNYPSMLAYIHYVRHNF
jgi:glycerophosphoryl diester phosphodiesterase